MSDSPSPFVFAVDPRGRADDDERLDARGPNERDNVRRQADNLFVTDVYEQGLVPPSAPEPRYVYLYLFFVSRVCVPSNANKRPPR